MIWFDRFKQTKEEAPIDKYVVTNNTLWLEGYDVGKKEGFDAGFADGYNAGRTAGLGEAKQAALQALKKGESNEQPTNQEQRQQ